MEMNFAQAVSESKVYCWSKKQQVYLESQQFEKMIDYCPKEPSYLS